MECEPLSRNPNEPSRLRGTGKVMAKKHHQLKSDALCPALEALIGDGGQITLGAVGPARNVAIAAMPAGMLAALVRRKGETLPQILQRLDAAVVQAVLENCVINEMTA